MTSDAAGGSQGLHFLARTIEFVAGAFIGVFGAWALSFPVYSLPGRLSLWGEAIPPLVMSALAVGVYLKSTLKVLAVGIVLGAIAETLFFLWLFASLGGMF